MTDPELFKALRRLADCTISPCWQCEQSLSEIAQTIAARTADLTHIRQQQAQLVCQLCGHANAHDGPAGDVSDACRHEGCECGYYVPVTLEVLWKAFAALQQQITALVELWVKAAVDFGNNPFSDAHCLRTVAGQLAAIIPASIPDTTP